MWTPRDGILRRCLSKANSSRLVRWR
jgi:hypothetical protein